MFNKSKNNTTDLISHRKNMKYILALEGIGVGVFAGFITILYRLILENAEKVREHIIFTYQETESGMVIWFIALIIMGIFVGQLLQKEPIITGGGVPQVEGELDGYFKAPWLRTIFFKFIGGILCIFGGLSLGRQGPSVQLGAMSGKGFGKILNRANIEKKYLITCGASAGLSAAFNAPLAGTMFALEEIHKNFSSTVLFSAMTASIIADLISKYVFGLDPVLQFNVESWIPLNYYWLILLLGILLGFAGVFYKKVLSKTQDLYQKISFIKSEYKAIIPFIIAGILGFTLPVVLGNGSAMFELLDDGNLLLKTMVLLFTVKFFFSMISVGSGAPGGVFYPLLVLGAYLGGIFGQFAVEFVGVSSELVYNFIILAMAGYFAAIVRAPVTGVVLISEMTGSLQHLLPLSVVVLVAEITAGLLGSESIYKTMLNRFLKNKNIDEVPIDTLDKMLLTFTIRENAKVAYKQVQDCELSEKCLLVSIRRRGKEIIPKGNTEILPEDIIVILVNENDAYDINSALREKCGEK
jgi:H+/Cl- antiporter ClcA